MEQDIFNLAAKMNCQELHMTVDESIGLKGVIAIHNTTLGPALGGCRFIEYPSSDAAILDAIRLAQGMTYKAAISNLSLGGGKMVVMKPKHLQDRATLFKAVGRFIETLQGRYITAMDSGTSVEDMDIIRTTTEHVTNTTNSPYSESDPSGMTAQGVLRGIEAAVQYKLGQENLHGVRIAIQGVGHAGFPLAQRLHKQGAQLFVYDINESHMNKCVQELGAKKMHSLDAMLDEDYDIFAPCALGGIINDDTVSKLRCRIVAGCANNQLEEPKHGKLLMERGILYAPDYVINAGGLIYVAGQVTHIPEVVAKQQVDDIYTTLTQIFSRADKEGLSTHEIADAIAIERLSQRNKRDHKELIH